MVGLLARCTEKDVQGIADDLGNRSVVGKDDVGHAREVFIQKGPQYIRL